MPQRHRLHPAWIILGVLLFATNLRGPFTAVGPVLEVIQQAFHIGAGQAGLLITLPLLTFCLVSPFAALLAKEYGLERVLFLALIVMMVGIGVRSIGPLWSLYFGTAVLGAGIAIGNTLVPSLLKRDFPNQIARLTAVYAITMGIGSAVASAVVAPLAAAFDWRVALGVFIILPIISAIAWLPQLRRHSAPAAGTAEPLHSGSIWRSGLAWQITLFFGCTSFTYYAVAAWLPSILVSQGYSPIAAGSLHGVLQLATALPGLLLPPLIGRMKDQRVIAAGLGVMGLVAILGLYLAPTLAVLWIALFGAGIGGAFILALTFIALRARNAHQTARLSGMVQAVGYLMSATGPVAVGALHDVTHNWLASFIACGVLCVAIMLLGLGAGRARHV